MPVKAGELGERLAVYRAVQTRNETGEATLAPSLFATVWGAVRPLTSREGVQYGQTVGTTLYKVQMRFLRGLTMDMWIVYQGRKLEISAIDEYEQQLYVMVTCAERHSPGTA